MATETMDAAEDAAIRAAISRCAGEIREAARRRGPGRAGRGDPAAAATVMEGFVAELAEIAPRLGALTTQSAAELGRDAARQVASAASWSEVVGERLDTSQATAMLGVTRQALAKRQSSGSMVGLPGRRTTWFPIWQFDHRSRRVRPVVKEVTSAFKALLGTAEPALVASWATTPQHEDLDGDTPAHWIETGGDTERVVQAAHRAAARLAQ